MKKRVLPLVLIVMMLCSVGNVQAIESSETSPYYVGIAQVTVALNLSNDTFGTISECYTFVSLHKDFSADVTMSLQRSTDKESWSTVKTWESSGEEEVEILKDYYVVDGYYYRVNVLVYVYYSNGNMAEIVSKYSPIQP